MNDDLKYIGIVLFADVEELDAIGPWEVLSYWTHTFPADGYALSCVSASGGLVRCTKSLVVQADHSFATAPPFEVLVYRAAKAPGRSFTTRPSSTGFAGNGGEVPLMTSVCTGSPVYAAAGLLAGRSATTHWRSLDLLTKLDPTIDVRPRDRFVDDGDVITSARVSAEIDMALHLVKRLAGVDRAREARRGIQYDPAPPV